MRLAGSRATLALLAAAAGLPRLAVLAVEQDDILAEYVEKSDSFARTFVQTGTYGLVPGEPSAYTQPLYGFFLVPLYWLFDRSWLAIGLAQVALAVATAALVYLVALRVLSRRGAVIAALLSTLHPYLVWHDVHVNREIVDQVAAAGLVLAYLALSRRPSFRIAVLAGAAGGIAILGNARLTALPALLALLAAYEQRWSRRAIVSAAVSLVAVVAALTPWLLRNELQLGCVAITTDSRALWKANNPLTYNILARGGWIDEVPDLPGAPPTPADAEEHYARTGEVLEIDECALMSYYRSLVTDFWRDEPLEKARLSAQAAGMLWSPMTTATTNRPGEGTWLDAARTWPEAAWAILVYAFALVGLRASDPRFTRLALVTLAYSTVAAIVFVGATRYRVPWDFVLCILAAAGIERVLTRQRAPSG